MTTFRKELEALINRCRMENGSDTPDFVLADYLTACLQAFNAATVARDRWYGLSLQNNHVVIPLQDEGLDDVFEADEYDQALSMCYKDGDGVCNAPSSTYCDWRCPFSSADEVDQDVPKDDES